MPHDNIARHSSLATSSGIRRGAALLWAASMGIALLCASAPAGAQAPGPVAVEIVKLQPVQNASIAPYSSICRLSVARRKIHYWLYLFPSWATSTGFLINDARMPSSGHTFLTTIWTRVVDMEQDCGHNGGPGEWASSEPFSRERVKVANGYSWHDYPRDYSMVRLGQTAPYPPAFRMARPDEMSALAPGDSIHVAGYASEGDNHGNRLYHARAVLTDLGHPDLLEYNVDTQRGMSGGPVWIEKGGEFVVIGIHVSEGMARRVTARLLGDLETWALPPASRE